MGFPAVRSRLIDEGSDELYIEASFGLDAAGQQTRYRLGEGSRDGSPPAGRRSWCPT